MRSQIALKKIEIEKQNKFEYLFALLIISDETFHHPLRQCLTIGTHNKPALVESILNITQLYKHSSRLELASTYKLRGLTVPEKPRLGWWRSYLDSKVFFIVVANRLPFTLLGA